MRHARLWSDDVSAVSEANDTTDPVSLKLRSSLSIQPSEGSRSRVRRTRSYLWNFNRFSPGKPCQKLDSETRQLLMVIDVGMAAWFATRLIVTRGPIILQARNPLNPREACIGHAVASAARAASLCAGHAQ